MKIMTLIITAFTIGGIHTALGPDHYLPFIALSKSREWSLKKTLVITTLSGMAHVGSSVLLGLLGIALGIKLNFLEKIETVRGDLIGWAFLIFGLIYVIWGLKSAYNHTHNHELKSPKGNSKTAWTIFLIFAFGPCEPVIPVLMFPAAIHGIPVAIGIALVFLLSTLIVMVGVVSFSYYGLKWIPGKVHRFGHAIAGSVILGCGLAVKLGL